VNNENLNAYAVCQSKSSLPLEIEDDENWFVFVDGAFVENEKTVSLCSLDDDDKSENEILFTTYGTTEDFLDFNLDGNVEDGKSMELAQLTWLIDEDIP